MSSVELITRIERWVDKKAIRREILLKRPLAFGTDGSRDSATYDMDAGPKPA